jgi:hypothetical protein
MPDKTSERFARFKKLKARKQVWNIHWQILAEYIMTRKADFTTTFQPGEFLNDHIFDGTAIMAMRKSSSALIGALWGNGARSMRLNPPQNISKTVLNNKYYEWATEQMHFHMNNPKAGLSNALEEYMRDQSTFGTSGLAIFKSNMKKTGTPITYRAWDVKQMSIDEGEAGFIDTVYYEFEWPLRKVIEKYGIENISSELKKIWSEDGNKEHKVRILHVIEPRSIEDSRKKGNQNMPWASVHYEIGTRKILLESGFDEMPIKVARFQKNINEVYGRGSGMDALPDILEANTVAEALTVAIEKQLDPPLGLLDDGKLGGGVVDTSAGALNVFNPAGRLGADNPIFPLFTVGELASADTHLQRLQQSIKEHFMIDILLDFNIEKEMTLGEAQIRNKLRSEGLGSLFARQISEAFVPMIERSFNVFLEAGLLGVLPGSPEEAQLIADGIEPMVIPDEIVNAMASGQDVYNIQFLTPAMRIMQIEQAQGIAQGFDFAGANANVFPQLKDNLNADEAYKKFLELAGFPLDLILPKKDVDESREAQLEAIEQQVELDQAEQGVGIAEKAAKTQAIK